MRILNANLPNMLHVFVFRFAIGFHQSQETVRIATILQENLGFA